MRKLDDLFPPHLHAVTDYSVHAIAVLPAHYPIPTHSREEAEPAGSDTQPRPELFSCSCQQPTCPDPARHPIGTPSLDGATTDISRLARAWTWNTTANIAAPTGHTFDTLRLHHPTTSPPHDLLTWLAATKITIGPTIHAPGPSGYLELLIQPSDRNDTDLPPSTSQFQLHYAGRDALTLLPPSRLIDGTELLWLRPLDGEPLPTSQRLLDALSRLPTVPQLTAWATARCTAHPTGPIRQETRPEPA